ncbi:hypothetical protein A3C23_04895 [Candidatus Roizmanbacteria bacterium RIFCSPHIGHO2_02_FULL_37_13b]|uniref:Phosphoadenosine phosphosulphate reductase domain-containing protein n=1 Tax=Candidatus Roizmanbacteria bacterium RIFCSPLOWO2_02_FULL_36_11 TaxID=1802071 RepID=A0A1F7JCU8_9BACT|nr:MAG: hypothetical protein A3C23_04895 [Candidatus Roizmanbacteria bacterium RIFCSPHIGHO2_02_FULL_37_13b]OGK53439.1 MAG: hypothetical protein A3H78_02800 [Candidatus Roizmanbacteria bacterium RIFCSPLOWO2_02_FULL_36_11]
MTLLDKKVKKSHQIIKKTTSMFDSKDIAIAWTGGKDSTVILHLVKTLFNGLIPFQIMFNDSTVEFPEVYKFIKEIKKDWKLKLIWVKHLPNDLKAYENALKNGEKEPAMEIMRIAKINAIKYTLKKYKFKAIISGIRKDEHEARSKETYFSKRLNHMRIHPILDFTFSDIWNYINEFHVPYVSLYDQGYKSLGEAPFTKPVKDKKAPERAGREATKEKTMNRLRQLGYW